jgi:hypothetical protein
VRQRAQWPQGAASCSPYQLPALLLPGLTLVVSPLIALMKDQVDFLRARGVAAARLDSLLQAGESSAILDGVGRGAVKILYVAPERFLNERFLGRLARVRVSLLAVDEAHCISQWGHNFRPDYLKLAAHARRLGVERVLALTATATPPVVDDIAAAFDVAPTDRVLQSDLPPPVGASAEQGLAHLPLPRPPLAEPEHLPQDRLHAGEITRWSDVQVSSSKISDRWRRGGGASAGPSGRGRGRPRRRARRRSRAPRTRAAATTRASASGRSPPARRSRT